MDKNRIKIVAAIGVVLMLVFVLPGIFKKAAHRKPAAGKAATAAETIAPLFKEAKSSDGKIADTEGLDDASLRDPFGLPEVTQTTASAASDLNLTGITSGAKGKLIAIINGNLVYAGSRVGNFTVVSISADKVVVTDGTENFELRMRK